MKIDANELVRRIDTVLMHGMQELEWNTPETAQIMQERIREAVLTFLKESQKPMTLVETLNNIHFVGDGEGLTFLADCNGDVDPDDARREASEFLHNEFISVWNKDYPHYNSERCKQLCIYGAALFEAIDAHEAYSEDIDCRDVPR